MSEVFILGAKRTPIGSFLGSLANRSAPELGAHAIGAAVAQSNVDPGEIDEVLMAHPDVAQAVTFALPHEKLGEEVAAALILKEGAKTNQAEIRGVKIECSLLR